jgi:hypothetical protein|tara:strand:+ start:4934 stop:5119 length:186 start_codon:yes stop_codon:yes gene_type:complete
MLTDKQYIKKYLLHKNMFSPSMMQVIDKEIAKLNTKTITTKKEQKYFDRLIYKSNIWKLLK